MVTALYRRYRPENFAELIGQAQVTAPLMTALRADRVNHAYLFSGPRGCGKTTSARILARCLNCAEGPTDTPCGKCPSCIELSRDGGGSLDVVEIDAASHNGVDDARDLRERAAFAPVRDRYKIFILDEAHMVTAAGFNALLKIVEEPPAHVKFIFATTEPDKVIATIRSRTHHYPFRLVPPAQMLDYLEQLCKSEKVEVAPGVLGLVVRSGGGSVRDSLSLLDQLIAGSEKGRVEYDRAVALLGYTPDSLLDEIVDALSIRDSQGAFRVVDSVIQSGQDPRQFVEDILERLRDLMLVNAVGIEAKTVLRGLSDETLEKMRVQAERFGAAELTHSANVVNGALSAMSGATSPRLHLELMIGRVLVPAADASEVGSLSRIERLERRIGINGDAPSAAAPAAASQTLAAPAASASTPTAATPTQTKASASAAPASTAAKSQTATPASASAKPAAVGSITLQMMRDAWPSVLNRLEKQSRNAWVIALTLQVVDYAENVLTLRFMSKSDLDSFKESTTHPNLLRQAINEELGVTVMFKPFIPEGAPTTPIEVVAEGAANEPATEQKTTPEVTSQPASSQAEVKPAEPAKGKSRKADIPDEDRYGESMVRDILGGEPLDGPTGGR